LGGTVVVPPGINNRVVIILFFTFHLKQELQTPLCEFEDCKTLKLLEEVI
jgi:hypothetical protein